MKLYLTGGTGFLGSNLIRVAREEHGWAVFTTVHTWQASSPVDFAYGRVDIGDRAAVLQSVRDEQPDAIVHSAILNDFGLMYRNRALAWRSYVDATRHLVDAANMIGCRIILVSTDWVFDGTQLGATESTPPNPINYYGVLKMACERVVAERGHHGAIARVAGVNGVHWLRRDEAQVQNAGYGHLATALLTELQERGAAAVWSGPTINMRATPSLASEAARMIVRIIDWKKEGIFHCCGGEAIGRADFARLVAETFGYDPEQIELIAHGAGEPDAMRAPYDTSLSAAQTAQELDYHLPSVRELLGAFKTQLTTGGLA
jgi:dTDP-4-dehydrorhamnose reductase